MSAALVEKIEIWGFESGFTIFTDGSLGFGLETSALDVSCWDEPKIDSIGASLTSFLNGLPAHIDIQFVLTVGRGDGSRIKEHQALNLLRKRERIDSLLSKIKDLFPSTDFRFSFDDRFRTFHDSKQDSFRRVISIHSLLKPHSPEK